MLLTVFSSGTFRICNLFIGPLRGLSSLSSVPSPPLESVGDDMSDVGAATSPSPPRVHRCGVRLRPAPCTALVLYVEPSVVIAEALRRPSNAESTSVGRMEL